MSKTNKENRSPNDESEKLIQANEAAQYVSALTGDTFHVNTISAWTRNGVSGVKLQSKKIGHRRYTTRKWIDEFIAALSKPKDSQNANGNPRSPADIRRGNAAAEKKLREKNAL